MEMLNLSYGNMTLVQQLVLNSWIFLVIPSSWLCSRLNYVAAVVDIGSYFVKAMYNLEGDGILAVKCYEEILKIRAAISAKYHSVPQIRPSC